MSKALDLDTAITAMRSGELVVYPTETYFALGCMFNNVKALEKVFALKKRPSTSALPLIIGDMNQLETLTTKLPSAFDSFLMKLELFFWPGALTVLFPAHARVSSLITADSGEVGVRLSSHPQAKELAKRLGPLVASSANFSGESPVIDPETLAPELLNATAGYIIPRPKPAGLAPSTIIRPNGDASEFEIVRCGVVTPQRLKAAGFIVKDY
ncbi:L-threonylcarbamoyladenylate synthase [Desulfovibrio litoralis]|uniref:L-threonylcarbamoyladenylate synthase n=1 Tax=Desulfovibrio litoralis DSM 11393 TaxID=1121455 RepID=A0A1M7T6Q9_9BACT|nr:L-threonylcarbamoyladenylate synthase [Desulfovibrio litoralis]SHN66400.1 L-threonylcarbamoyladenylate synthase [Desulfovibrio litoralis DSM 11393]